MTCSTLSDPNELAFFWAPQMPEKSTRLELLDGDKEDRFYIDPGNQIRFRVESDEFIDDEPGPPKALEGVRLEKEAKRPPYSIIVSESTKTSVRFYVTRHTQGIYNKSRVGGA